MTNKGKPKERSPRPKRVFPWPDPVPNPKPTHLVKRLEAVERAVKFLTKKVGMVMGLAEDLQAAQQAQAQVLGTLNTQVQGIAAEVADLISKLPAVGQPVTQDMVDQATVVKNGMQALSDALSAIPGVPNQTARPRR